MTVLLSDVAAVLTAMVAFAGFALSVYNFFELQPGGSAMFWTLMKEVKLVLQDQGCKGRESVKACFRTAVGSEFVSRSFPINVGNSQIRFRQYEKMMQFINVLSLTHYVNAWLANSHHPRILHVFEHACNLINERREVLSVVTLQIGNGPFNLVIEDDVLFSDHLNLQSPISNSSNYLNLGDLTIHTDNARLWSPRPDWEMLRARRDSILDQLAKLPITDDQKCGGFDTPLNDHSGLLNHQRLPITQSPVSNLQFSNSLASALANADLPASITATQKLAGLGIGLTPAGDDFIMGAILAAWIIHPVDVAGVLAAEVTEVAAALTTSLSGAWLRSVERGEAGILWHQFFDALISADPTAIQASMHKILSVGETSGADALFGFISSFMAWSVEERTSHG